MICPKCKGAMTLADIKGKPTWVHCGIEVEVTEPTSTKPAMTAQVAKMAQIANPSLLKYDPSLDNVPEEIAAAETLIVEFMEKTGATEWCLRRICSRNHADKLQKIAATIIE